MPKIDMLLVYPRPSKDSPLNLTPLSILFPGALFESQGMSVAYCDLRFDSLAMLDDLIREAKEIGVSAFTGFQAGEAARVLKRAKSLNPSIATGVGGHHARILSGQCLAEPFVDKVWPNRVYGEHLFPYNDRVKHIFARGDMQYFTSRGCPFSCTFCAVSSPWEPKEIGTLDRELKVLRQDIEFKEISFSDPNIGFAAWKDGDGKTQRMDRVQRIRDIGKIMRDTGIIWDGSLRAPYLTKEMAGALEEANCFSLEIGCESGNDHFLKRVLKKGHGVEAIKTAARNMRGANFTVNYSFIAFMPRETKEMVEDTCGLIDWIKDADPNARVSVHNYAPYPGTPMYEDAVAGVDGYPRFNPPTTMEGWGALRLMQSPIYWISGLNFRRDRSRMNFPGDDWRLIQPYITLAEEKWRKREFGEFPCEEVERLIAAQHEKKRAGNMPPLTVAEAWFFQGQGKNGVDRSQKDSCSGGPSRR